MSMITSVLNAPLIQRYAAAAALWLTVLPGSGAIHASTGNRSDRLTVESAMEMRRVLRPFIWGSPLFFSPDRSHYAIRLVRDDLQREGSWVELFVGRTNSLEGARDIRLVSKLFTTSRRDEKTGRNSPIDANLAGLKWSADGKRVAFLWNDGDGATHVRSVDVKTEAEEVLINHPTSVVDFSFTPDGRKLVYLAFPDGAYSRSKLDQVENDGLVVAAGNVNATLAGYVDGASDSYRKELFVSDQAMKNTRQVQCHPDLRCGWMVSLPDAYSSDGRYAISLSTAAARLPTQWDQYDHPELGRAIASARRSESYSEGHRVARIAVMDVDNAVIRPLLEAPSYALGAKPSVVWSPDNKKVVMGPIFLPLSNSDYGGRSGGAVAEVDVATGHVSPLPIPASLYGKLHPTRWDEEDEVHLSDGTIHLTYKKRKRRWQIGDESAQPMPFVPTTEGHVRVELREDLNSPPTLYALDTQAGREQLVLEIEPRLVGFQLGRVEAVEWGDAHGRAWQGRIYYPVGYAPGRRYPLVIQFDAPAASNEFSLLGGGDMLGAPYAAQPMASRDIAVLSLNRYQHVDEKMETPEEPRIFMEGVEAAVAHLDHLGLIDPAKVGIIGFSRTGGYVEFVLAQSTFPFAAGIAADNFDFGYIQSVLFGGLGDSVLGTAGAAPIGDGLASWLAQAPGFNTHKIRAPLRLETDIGGLNGLLGHWEMFTLLHHQRKPVELVMVPNYKHGSHPLVMPKQKLFSQEGTVDWMDFWLNGHEDTDPRKAQQYQRWRKLRALQDPKVRH